MMSLMVMAMRGEETLRLKIPLSVSGRRYGDVITLHHYDVMSRVLKYNTNYCICSKLMSCSSY